jgi:N-acetylglucosaminyldiphosphoundecaprenol N-acetyl-beta-D-mannosaminyltransferase
MAIRSDTQREFLCCGIRVDAMHPEDAVRRLTDRSATRAGQAVHLCNAYTLSLALRDPGFSAMLNRGDLNLPDGMPLVWAARRAGFPDLRRRVYGPDLMIEVVRLGRVAGFRHYLYGSTPEVITSLTASLAKIAPGVQIVGAEAPPFRPLSSGEEAQLVQRIRDARPDIVWVGLGTPAQDHFVDSFRDRCGVILVAVGAAFDFLAGTKRQAPPWMQDHGLEWVFRLAIEPRRLWRRYLIGNAWFLRGVWRQLLGLDG